MSLSRFISAEEIRTFCGDCPSREMRVSKMSQQAYDFCKSYQSPCYKVIDLCQYDKTCKVRAEIEAKTQKTLQDFSQEGA